MERRSFINLMAAAPLAAGAIQLKRIEQLTEGLSPSERMPVLFIGHGHPMNALFDNTFTQSLSTLANHLPRPEAIMVVSAHWQTKGTFVSVAPKQHTIHDFGPFDQRLFEIRYDTHGHPERAREVIGMAGAVHVREDHEWGLDHGAWSVLRHIWPKADIPVFQLSIDYTKGAAFHFDLAEKLRKLRNRGVLIIGSGNIVHNLGNLDWSDINAKPFDWALEFDSIVKTHILNKDYLPLVNYQTFGTLAQLAVPTNDHYLPMIYSLGLADKNEATTMLFEGMQYGSVSMRCFRVG
ncbi:MAG: 4,5-DOPA dioxygenase extradiol [Bacteroidota bacterium]